MMKFSTGILWSLAIAAALPSRAGADSGNQSAILQAAARSKAQLKLDRAVAPLLREAKALFEVKRFDLAYKRYDQVLDIDPGNEDARKGERAVIAARKAYTSIGDRFPTHPAAGHQPAHPAHASRPPEFSVTPALPKIPLSKDPDAARMVYAKMAIAEGDKQYKHLHYDVAAGEYQLACDHLPESPVTHKERESALDDFCRASVRLAEQRITEGRYNDAKEALKTVLDSKYDPNYTPAIKLLGQLDDTDFFNTTTGPKISDKIHEVQRLFLEAKGFYDSGRFDLAYKRYDQILDLDPTNVAARKGQEDVIAAKKKYADAAYKVDNSWADGNGMPPRKYINPHPAPTEASGTTEYVQNKLNHIVIPKISFKDATLQDVIVYLHQRSVELDTVETNPAQKGVNIVLKLESAPDAGSAGKHDDFPGPTLADEKITLDMSNTPLAEALKFISQLAGLKMNVDPDGVVLTPIGTSGIQMAPTTPSSPETPKSK